jgi:hypothetical protein
MNDLRFDLTIIFSPYWFCTEKLTTKWILGVLKRTGNDKSRRCMKRISVF